MLKLVFKNDGSIKYVQLPQYVTQGTSGVESVKLAVAFEDKSDNFSAIGYFKLPNGDTVSLALLDTDEFELFGETYPCKCVYLDDSVTLYEGIVLCSIRVTKDVGSTQLYTYNFRLTVNPTTYEPDDTDSHITNAQYQNLADEVDELLQNSLTKDNSYTKEEIEDLISNGLEYGGYNTISDANDAELNKFYWISSKTTNFPNNDSKVGLLINMGYSDTYRTQIYALGYGTNNTEIYVRNIVGSGWSNWNKLASDEGLIKNTRQGYDVGPNDCNDAANNTFLTIVNKTTNYPKINTSGFLYTTYSLANDAYGVQMLIERSTNQTGINLPTIWIRSKNNNVFYPWFKIESACNPHPTLSAYKRIAGLGDSFTAGYMADKTNTIQPKNFEYSWVRMLARRNGAFGGVYAKTGVTFIGFLTDSDCLPALLNDDDYDLYIIALGINDSLDTFGTADDIDLENPLDSENTSCGSLAKIKYYIEQKNPDAKIVVCQLPIGVQAEETINTKNTNLKASTVKLNIGFAEFSVNRFPTGATPFSANNHPTIVGQQYLSTMIEEGVQRALIYRYYNSFTYHSSENNNNDVNMFAESLAKRADIGYDASEVVSKSELATTISQSRVKFTITNPSLKWDGTFDLSLFCDGKLYGVFDQAGTYTGVAMTDIINLITSHMGTLYAQYESNDSYRLLNPVKISKGLPTVIEFNEGDTVTLPSGSNYTVVVEYQ